MSKAARWADLDDVGKANALSEAVRIAKQEGMDGITITTEALEWAADICWRYTDMASS